MFSICLKYSRNYAEAQDNLQDAFITIFKKVNQYKNKGSFEGWLKRITVNTALQRYRKKSVLSIINENELEDEVVEIEDNNLTVDYLLSIIQKLPDKYRLIFNLYVLDGYSHKEIAEMLNINIGTSKSNLSRARQLLKKTIEEYKTNLPTQLLK